MLFFVASPAWLTNRVPIFFDCRRLDGTMFSCFVHPRLSVGSLLLAAGLSATSSFDVFAHGLIRPLPVDQLVDLVPGMLLTLEPTGCGAPATYDLAGRLMSTEGWDPEAHVPPPHQSTMQPTFQNCLVLTEGMPRLYTTDQLRASRLHEDLARDLGSPEHLLTIVHAATAVAECSFRGLPLQSVLVATQQLVRLPFPPARRQEDRQILFLDCRFVLQSFLWLLLDGPYVRVQEIVNLFRSTCPAGHIVSVTGAVTRNSSQGALFHVPDGTVLQVTYIEDLLTDDVPSQAHPPSDPENDCPDEDDDSPDGTGDTGASSSRNQSTRGPLGLYSRQRSRTPRHAAPVQHGLHHLQELTLNCADGHGFYRQVDMWFARLLHDALAESPRHITSVQLPLQLHIIGSVQPQMRFSPHHLWDRLVRELRLCVQSYHPRIEHAHPAGSCLSLTQSGGTPVSTSDPTGQLDTPDQLIVGASFAILTPDYSHETLALDLLVPQPLQEVLDLIAVCRDWDRKSLFPRLIPVNPQPDIRWGTLLALPAWHDQTVLVCINTRTYALRGTLFAAIAPRHADRYRLLLLANLPLSTAVNIHRPHSPFPISDGEEIRLHTGDCITFCPPGTRPDPELTLEDMVQTHLPWGAGPPFPEPSGDRCYCVVSDQGYRGFQLRPDRSMHYKLDIAQLLHLRSSLLSLRPAQPTVADAADCGLNCVTVVAVGESYRHESNDFETVGLLDCRPLLSGWYRLTTCTGWISIEPTKTALALQSPQGWTVHISGCLPRWTWTWLSPGQVLVASLSPISADAYPAESPTQVLRHSDSHVTGNGGPCYALAGTPRLGSSPRSSGVSAASSSSSPGVRNTRHVTSQPAPQCGLLRSLLCTVMLTQARGMQSLQVSFSIEPIPVVRPILPMCHKHHVDLSSAFASSACFLSARSSADLTVRFLPALHKLLQEGGSPDMPASTAYDNARAATQRLGLPWPRRERAHHAPLDLEAELADRLDADATALTQTHFMLIAPEYDYEALAVQLDLPQAVPDVLLMLDSLRRQDLRELFPVLCPAFPQPLRDCGCVLLVPAWPTERVIVCINRTSIDGRLFAAHALPVADKHALLNLAGFSGAALLDVYIAHRQVPVEYGEDVQLTMGMCISFVEPEGSCVFSRHLESMLHTRTVWAPYADPATGLGEDRFCVVSEGFYFTFPLLPARASFFHADIASRLQLQLSQTALTPASPGPLDVCLYGCACQNVIGVSVVTPPQDTPIVVFLDCRPLLEGWRCIITDRGWLDLRPFHAAFMQGAPHGFCVHFSGCSSQPTWLHLAAGRVLRVSYIPVADAVNYAPAPSVASPDRGPTSDDHDHSPPFAPPPPLTARPPSAGTTSRHCASQTQRSPAEASSLLLACPSGVKRRYGLGSLFCPSSVAGGPQPFATGLSFQHCAETRFKCAVGINQHVPSTGDSRWDTPAPRLCTDRYSNTCILCYRRSPRYHRLLQEPVDSASSHWGPVAQARIVAHAFGQPWPHQPHRGHFAPVVDALHPATTFVGAITLAVCVLTPGHLREEVFIHSHPEDTTASLVSELRQARDADKHRLYPFIDIPRVQPHGQWLLALAFPSWAVVDCFVAFDLTLVDARFYTEAVPATLSRQAVLDIVRLPTHALDIYIDEDARPLPDDVEFQAQTGMLITLRPAAVGRPAVASIQQVLHAAANGEPFPVFLPSPTGRHLCIVTERGHTVFSVAEGQDLPSPMAIPSLLGHPSGARICPSHQQLHDVEAFGFPCSAVLAIVDPADDEQPYACIFDARGLLQGWILQQFGEEGLPIEDAVTLLETFMPPHWQLHLSGAATEAGHFCCYDGHVIQASFVPEDPDSASDGHSTEDDDHESFVDDPSHPSPDPSVADSSQDVPHRATPTSGRSRSPRRGPSSSETAFRPHARAGQHRQPIQPHRSMRRLHPPVGAALSFFPFGRRLQGLICFLSLIPAQGVARVEPLSASSACAGPFPAPHCFSGRLPMRPLPTPLRNACHGPSQVCASPPAEPQSGPAITIGPLRTLLQESLADPQCPAMFLSATLLDTLFEHFTDAGSTDTSESSSARAPRHISLTDCIVPTTHQRQCLALEKELPHTFEVDEAPDWLDNDLTALLRNRCISLDLRTRFVNLRCWHAEGSPTPSRLSIYTDGSASSDPSDLRPASWAFVVFAQVQGADYLVGHASSVTAPPCSPYHLGENRDDALTGELLALCWGLAWTAQYGSSFEVPVDFFYDSQCAGGGVFGISRSPTTGANPAAYTSLASCAIALRQYASARAIVQHAYVPSHTGHIGNELADGLAKTARTHTCGYDECTLPLWVSRFARHRLKDWAWAMVPGHADLPRPYVFEVEASCAGLNPPAPAAVPTQGLQTHNLPAAEATYDLCCVSFNALTLKDPKTKRYFCCALGAAHRWSQSRA